MFNILMRLSDNINDIPFNKFIVPYVKKNIHSFSNEYGQVFYPTEIEYCDELFKNKKKTLDKDSSPSIMLAELKNNSKITIHGYNDIKTLSDWKGIKTDIVISVNDDGKVKVKKIPYYTLKQSIEKNKISSRSSNLTKCDILFSAYNECIKRKYKLLKPLKIDGAKSKLAIKCNIDGTVFFPSYSDFYGNAKKGCPTCGRRKCDDNRKTDNNIILEEFINIIETAKLEFVKVLKLDGSVNSQFLVKCKENCNHKPWAVTHNRVKYGNGLGCGECYRERTDSKNLIDIDNILIEYNTCKEKRFDDCKFKLSLPFDRYVHEKNILIEYDGEQHFCFKKTWHKKIEIFNESKIKDSIKTKYAINNGYNFIRIAYYEDHVKSLESFLALVKKHQNKQIVQIYGEVQILDKP